MIQAVVFDIGNVLIEWLPERYLETIFGTERVAEFGRAIDLYAMNERVDAGENFHAVLDEMIATHPDWATELIHWRDHWIKLAAPAIPKSIDLLRRLRANGVPVFALSNFGVETFAMAEEEYPFLTEFDRRYISGHMQVTKPDPRIYEMVETDCGLAPETLLFADDRLDNIKACQTRGWSGHLFETPEAFERCLIAHGLLGGGQDPIAKA